MIRFCHVLLDHLGSRALSLLTCIVFSSFIGRAYGVEIPITALNQHAVVHGPISLIVSIPAVIEGKKFIGDQYYYPAIVVDDLRVSDLDFVRFDYDRNGIGGETLRFVISAQLGKGGGYLLTTPGEHVVRLEIRNVADATAFSSTPVTVVAHRDESAVIPLAGEPEVRLVRSIQSSAFNDSTPSVSPEEWALVNSLGNSFLAMQAKSTFAGYDIRKWDPVGENLTTEEIKQLEAWLLAAEPASTSPRLGIYAMEARLIQVKLKETLNRWDNTCNATVQEILAKKIPGMTSVAQWISKDHDNRQLQLQEDLEPQGTLPVTPKK